MSKLYRVDMNLETNSYTLNGGFLGYTVEKEVDARGYKERNGKEIFCYLANSALSGANQRVSYAELKTCRKIQADLDSAANGDGRWVCNKTELDKVKDSIRDNKNWFNSDEMLVVLDAIMARINGAEIVE